MLVFYAQLLLCYNTFIPKSQRPVILERKKKEEVAGRISRLQPAPNAKYMGIGPGGEWADMLNVSNYSLGKKQQHKQSMMLLELLKLLKHSPISVIARICYYNLSLFISH